MQGEAIGHPERARELLAVRYYLRALIEGRDARWYEQVATTNHRILLAEIRRLRPRGEPVLIATFNYDRMIEWALRDLQETPSGPRDDLAHYLAQPQFIPVGARSRRQNPGNRYPPYREACVLAAA
jgi:hypothetical protein